MKVELALLTGLLVIGSVSSSIAGSALDTDGDLVPDQFDNCLTLPNGPNEGTNQVDSDLDGYGNRCDTDFDNSLTTTVSDCAQLIGAFGTAHRGEIDLDGSGTVTTADFGLFMTRFSAPPGAPGPSGLSCAGTTPCTP